MNRVILTKQQACRFLLSHQGLLPPRTLRGKEGALRHIRHVGCIQFDPIDVVGRNPELTLQSRVNGFTPGILAEMLYQDRSLVDGWDKMMSIYCLEDWPFFARCRKIRGGHVQRVLKRRNSEKALSLVQQIRKSIEKRGPLSSNDLDFGTVNKGSWGHSRLSGAALDYMYQRGELGIYKKVNSRKIYDLAERLLPDHVFNASDPFKTEEEFYDWYYLRRIGSIGLLWNRPGDAWLGYFLNNNELRNASIKRLLDRGELIEVWVEGLNTPFCLRRCDEGTLNQVLQIRRVSQSASFLAPLDNLLWDRRLIETLFGFRYTWEVYKPPAKRKYGYYVLPVLYGDRFVARFEPVRDKKRRVLTIRNWWWEKNVQRTKALERALQECFIRFLRYLDVDAIEREDKREDLNWFVKCNKRGGRI